MGGEPKDEPVATTAPSSRTTVSAAPPQTLGDFRIVRTLGRGGMAVVYFAEHPKTGARVAIKTNERADASLLSGIRREIHALRRVDHPGVVRIVAEGVEGELPWYAMEVVEGRTLRELDEDLAAIENAGGAAVTIPLARRASMPPIAPDRRCFQRAANGALPRVLKLVRAICDALAFVHGMGLVHRDLKPENVMVRPDGSPVLVDFGLAMQLRGVRGRDVLEQGDRYIGTPSYMAPEQIDGELMDARVDLYALGCILYELVTGAPPFLGSIDEVLDQHLRDLPIAPSIRVSDVPRELDNLILALLQKRPRDRIGYADDVAAALARLGAGDELPARRAEPHLYRPRLSGRAGALAIVEDQLKSVRVSSGGLTLVGGESGVGKTRFAMEVGLAANRRGLAIVTGQCVSIAASDAPAEIQAASLHPLRHLLSTIAAHCDERGLEESERIFGPRGPALAVHEPSIRQLPGQDRYPRLAALADPATRARLNTSLAAALAAFAESQPLVLVIEDLQWADEATMSFLKELDPAYFTSTRALVLGTYRSEETSDELRALLDSVDVTRIDLGRLDANAVARMVSDMLSMASPPAAFIQFLVERSEGHPFFVAEYLRLAVQERVLVRNDVGAWRIHHLTIGASPLFDALPLPGELRALVSRRVAALGPGALAVARMAAVLGREVDTGVLAAAIRLDDDAYLEALEELRTRQIVDIEGARLRFVHDKLREIIHAEIDPDEQRRLHAAAGATKETRLSHTSTRATFYPDLVHHFTVARDDVKAFEYLVKAGQAALDATASTEAMDFFRRALALADDRPGLILSELSRAGLESRLGRAAFNVGLLPEAERLTLAALHRFRGEPVTPRPSRRGVATALLGQLIPQARLLLGPQRPASTDPVERQRLLGATQAAQTLFEIYFLQQQWDRGLSAALERVALASRLGLSLELVQGYVTLGIGLSTLPFPRVRALYEARARETAAALDDSQGLGWVALLSGFSALRAGRFREARPSLDVALAVARAIQDPRQIELCLGLLAMLERLTGRLDTALAREEEFTAAAQKSGNLQSQIWALGGLANRELTRGHGERAIALFEQRRTLAEDYRNDPTEWIMHGIAAEAHLLVGDHERARRVAETTLRHMQELRVVGFRFYRGCISTADTFFALHERATTHRERAELARLARRACEKVQAFAGLYAIGLPQALRFRGLLEALSGHPARARRAFAESLAEAERLSMPFEQGLAHYELGRRLARGDPARDSHLVDARSIFARLGQVIWQDRLNHLG